MNLATNFNYDSYRYFFDLLAFSLLLAPAFYALKGEFPRRILLIIGSMYVMYFIAARLLLFYIIFWTGVCVLQRIIAYLEKKGGSGFFFPVAIIITLAPMLVWKAFGAKFDAGFNFAMNDLLRFSQTLWEIDMAQNILAPLGISIAVFRALDLLIKTYLGRMESLSFDRVMHYGFFAPVQIVGPITEYEETAKLDQKPDPQMVFDGLCRVATGFIKIFFISTLLAGSADIIVQPGKLPAWQIWLALFAFSWHFYLNFSGYSDITIGIARVYGFKIRENFIFPLLFRRNIQTYWLNWHISLTRFTERNIFIPLGGYRPKTQYFAIIVSMLVIGLWHNFNTATLFYGFYHGFGLATQRFYSTRLGVTRVPGIAETVFYHLLTYVFVCLGYPLLFVNNFGEAMVLYKALLGIT